jgi:hypothetical protein
MGFIPEADFWPTRQQHRIAFVGFVDKRQATTRY